MASLTVSVACKLPHGLQLQLYVFRDTPNGRLAQPNGKPVTLNGGNHKNAVEGWGLTENVDKAFMEEWLKANSDSAAVNAGLIVVRANLDAIVSEAKTRKDVKTGLEPLDPKKAPKGIEEVNKEDKKG